MHFKLKMNSIDCQNKWLNEYTSDWWHLRYFIFILATRKELLLKKVRKKHLRHILWWLAHTRHTITNSISVLFVMWLSNEKPLSLELRLMLKRNSTDNSRRQDSLVPPQSSPKDDPMNRFWLFFVQFISFCLSLDQLIIWIKYTITTNTQWKFNTNEKKNDCKLNKNWFQTE